MAKLKFPQSEGWITHNMRDPTFNGTKVTAEEAFNDLFQYDEISPKFSDYEVGRYKGKKKGYSITLRRVDKTKFLNLEIITT
jgi:hypothetical protein